MTFGQVMSNLKVNPNPDPQIWFLCEHGAWCLGRTFGWLPVLTFWRGWRRVSSCQDSWNSAASCTYQQWPSTAPSDSGIQGSSYSSSFCENTRTLLTPSLRKYCGCSNWQYYVYDVIGLLLLIYSLHCSTLLLSAPLKSIWPSKRV